MANVLWTRFLRHNPVNPQLFDLDRFVLSSGHGSALLYSLLHLTGYDVPLEQIKQFRQWGSITPSHPERGLTPGVETTTGPLGQGFANGVVMAMAEAHLAACYNRPGSEIINHFTYGLVSDGDLMEGVAAEAASLAGHLKLGKLIYLYDNNHITLAASTQLIFTEDHAMRFAAYGCTRNPSMTARTWKPSIMPSRRLVRKQEDPRLSPSGADAHRLWLTPQAGHLQRAWFTAGLGRSEVD